jgi:hypothetical protein
VLLVRPLTPSQVTVSDHKASWHQGAIAKIFEHDGIGREDGIEPFGFGVTRGHDSHDTITPCRGQGAPKEQGPEVHCDSSNEHALRCERPDKKGLEATGRHRDCDGGTPQVWLEEKARCQLHKGKVKEKDGEGSQGNQALQAVSPTPHQQAKN